MNRPVVQHHRLVAWRARPAADSRDSELERLTRNGRGGRGGNEQCDPP